jgi:uncharacterized protein
MNKTAKKSQPLEYQRVVSKSSQQFIGDELAYILPMLVFLVFVFLGGQFKSLYASMYVARAIIVAVMLAVLWKHYTKIRWSYWWLGGIVGIIGIVQWMGMQLWLESHFDFFKPSPDPFDPTKAFGSRSIMWSFISVRIAGAVLVVPVMEELFWRDYLWRTILAPNDFKLARVGEWGWAPFLIVSGVFATVHGNWWLTAIVWALMVAGLLVYTKSLGACIVAHATTNLLLAIYVLKTHDWSFW